MYICIYVYMYICIYVYMCICVYVYMYMYMYMSTEHHWADGQLEFLWLFWSVAGRSRHFQEWHRQQGGWVRCQFLVSNPSDPWDFAPGLKRLRIMRAWHFGDSRDIALGIKKGPFDRKQRLTPCLAATEGVLVKCEKWMINRDKRRGLQWSFTRVSPYLALPDGFLDFEMLATWPCSYCSYKVSVSEVVLIYGSAVGPSSQQVGLNALNCLSVTQLIKAPLWKKTYTPKTLIWNTQRCAIFQWQIHLSCQLNLHFQTQLLRFLCLWSSNNFSHRSSCAEAQCPGGSQHAAAFFVFGQLVSSSEEVLKTVDRWRGIII